MAVRNIKSERGSIFIPTDSNVYCKIIITDDSDVDYTLMNTYSGLDAENEMVAAPSIKRSATDALGSFKFTIANDGGRFLNKFNGGEVVKVYADNTDATTRIFTGKVDNVKYGLSLSLGFYVELMGRDYPLLIDKTITGVIGSATADYALNKIIDVNYSPDEPIGFTFWDGSSWVSAYYSSTTDSVVWSSPVTNFPTTLINMTYQHKKGWKLITEICKRAGLECYVEYSTLLSDFVLRVFLKESIVNTGANVAYGVNLTNMNSFGFDNNAVVNRVIVYGKTESDNILLVKTENDTSSQDNL